MRPLFSLSAGVAAVSLITMLTACGGGGGSDKAPVDPVGTLTFSGASTGKYVVNTTDESTVSSSTNQVTVKLSGTPTFVLGVSYSSTGIAVSSVEAGVNNGSTLVGYNCTSTCSNTALDKTARTLTFNNTPLAGSGGTTLTISGTVTWPAPTTPP